VRPLGSVTVAAGTPGSVPLLAACAAAGYVPRTRPSNGAL
jgi:hypothetical protein